MQRKYQKHTHHQHVLERPDTYIGSTKTNEETRWAYDPASNKMVWRKLFYNPGLYKIFDEIVVNARDEFVRSTTTSTMTSIKRIDVTVGHNGQGDTVISVENDGDGIRIEEDEEQKVMIPEMIFGHLLTSSNYNDSEQRIVGGVNGLGSKCLALDTKVPLWTAKEKLAGDLQVGDELLGDDGTKRTILAMTRGKGQMYEVVQANSEPYKVNDQHILTLHMPDHADSVFDISIQDYMALDETTKKQMAGIRGQCIQWPTCEVDTDPYIIGSQLNNKITNKHIPDEYLFNDRQTRLAVLAGMIDTDGSVSRNGTRITITQGMNHEHLAHDIVFLARSLGFNCQINKHRTVWTHKGEKRTGEALTMNISGHGLEDIPTRLPRKKCASPMVHNTSKSTGFITIKDIGIGEYVGFEIDGNQRFLINDFTVTHNCTNILSKLFTVDIKNPATGKQYSQSWYDNMYKVEKPSIKKLTSKTGSVKITFIPDRVRFAGVFDESGIINDMVAVFHTRIVELAALVGKDVKVTWNGAVISSNTFEKFIKLFLRDGMTGFAYENCGPRWEIGAILASHLYSDEEELPEDKHISFVNGINTKKGGKHVENVTRKILTDFCEVAKKKKVDIKPGQLKNSVVLFLNSTIVNPSFDSQSKEYLTTPAVEFGSKPEYSGKLVEGLSKLGLLEEAKHVLEAKTMREAKKTDGKKRTVLRGITKLEDALMAGTAKSSECTLILTEGDSAATSAISGLKEVGRERWGVFPLRGKLLNVRDITVQKFNANEELTAIKKILGLEQGKKYKDVSELRYGRVMVMADQDHDGSHIKGLLMNLFHAEWPGLMQSGFLCTLLTPILKASKGKTVLSFYSIPQFNEWKGTSAPLEALTDDSKDGPRDMRGWKIKYYKGLGTSTPAEAREWFKDLREIQYVWDEKTDDSINLAFNKKQADARKQWLSHYDPTKMLIPVENKATYTSFIDNELIHFSNADNIRSLPNVMDGLKPSQRKILYCCLKRNLKEEIRVAQLAGYVSEHAAYHHGEASLNGTIIGMAQNFVGSNNINLLKPMGQFGCLAPDTPILMWDGSIKHAENVNIGDELVGDDGQKRTILKTTNGIDDMFEIVNIKENKRMTVNSQHILTLYFEDNFKITWKESHSAWEYKYFNGVDIVYFSVRVNQNPSDTDHYNRSKITKEDGYERIVKMRDEYSTKYSTSTIIDIKLGDYMKLSAYSKKHLYMFTNNTCINWDKKSVPIDPYILGAWLGDGDHMGKGFTSIDKEIIESFVVNMKTIGAEVTHHSNSNHDGYHYCIRRKGSGHLPAIGSKASNKSTCVGCTSSTIPIPHDMCSWVCNTEPQDYEKNHELIARCEKGRLNPFTQILKDNGLFRNKHIPREYMINDRETRLQLLAGLIDTDGSLKGVSLRDQRYEICQSERLHGNIIHAIDFIAKSLGYATSIYKTKMNKLTKKGEDTTMLTITIFGTNINEIPTRIPRKMITVVEERKHVTLHYEHFTVKNIGKGPFYGWSIDGNERFLLGNFVVTHNSRLSGGSDAASPRYIHTYMEDIVSKIFRKEDACLLKHIDDDGDMVEPEYYLPVVPLLAINGSLGIGTGYSTDVPPHRPDDIVCLLRHRLEGSIETLEGRPLDPWWFGFKGKISRKDEATWLTKGLYELDDAKRTITITELPVGTWTKDYKAFLDELLDGDEKKAKEAKKDAKKAETESTTSRGSTKAEMKAAAEKEPCGLKSFDDLYNDVDVRFVLYFTEEGYDAIKENPERFEKQFKLTTSWKTTNMTCFDTEFNIVKYKTLGDILEAFVEKRLPLYEARRLSMLGTLQGQIEELDAKRRFIQAILEERLVLQKKTDEEIVAGLKENDIPALTCKDKPDEYDSYEYVLKMRIDRVKQSAVIELDKQIAEKESEIHALNAETGSSLWLKDLEEFLQSWEAYSKARVAESVSVEHSEKKVKKVRARKVVLKE